MLSRFTSKGVGKKKIICKNEVLSYMSVNSHGSEVMQWNHPHIDLVILLSKYSS